MDPKLREIIDSATPEALELLHARDVLLGSLRVEAAGADVTQWGPNSGMTRGDRERERQRLLAELRRAERDGEVTAAQAEEFGRLIRRLLR